MGDDTYGYAYDPIGNRTQSAAAAGSGAACTNAYAANALNQYTCITNFASFAPSRETLPAYDADGNLTAYGPWAYTWDAENRLVSACSNGVLLVTNVYDHRSRRVRKEVSVWDGQVEAYVPQSSAHYLWDGWNVVRETVAVGSGSTQSVATNYYTWGLDLSGTLQGAPLRQGYGGQAGGVGGLLAVLRNGTPYFPCYDANGNVTGYVATNGASVARREYDPFGRTTVAAGTMADDFNFWFSTKYLDHETGMSYYGYRFYSPELGRWPSRDPIEERGGLNLYGFVGNEPVNKHDILGMMFMPYEDPTLPAKQHDYAKVVIKVNKCKILVVYGHNYRNKEYRQSGTGTETIRVIRAADQKNPCAYAAVVSCFASYIPNEIPLPRYAPVGKEQSLHYERGPGSEAAQPNDIDEAKKVLEAAKVAAKNMFESPCCCKKVDLYVQTYGITTWDKVFGSLPNEIRNQTFYPKDVK